MTLSGDVTARQIVDFLTYSNYAHNRRLCPEVTPARWEKVYGPSVWEMEEQFQAEQATIQEERAL